MGSSSQLDQTRSSIDNLDIKNTDLIAWIKQAVRLCEPDQVILCDGSEVQHQKFIKTLVDQGQLIELNKTTNPNSYLYRSDPQDVARAEHLTYICTEHQLDAGPNNNWMDPQKADKKIDGLFKKSMVGRTMYIIPYCMAPIDSPYRQLGVELTDSLYVVINMKIMTRMGSKALELINDLNKNDLNKNNDYVKGLHCTGDLDPKRRYIIHFPEKMMIKSFGSGYGGNALLGKKCHALRLASYSAKNSVKKPSDKHSDKKQSHNQGWLAEHMLIMGIQNPQGKRIYIAAAFPSACGKTNLAMLLPGGIYKKWKIWTVGDDIAWLRPNDQGQFTAINPEAGFFGVAPGTSNKTNPNAFKMLKSDVIYTNVGLTRYDEPWWQDQGHKFDPLYDWQGKSLLNLPKTHAYDQAAHPNSRFTVGCDKCPSYLSPRRKSIGVPISAILFGSRRSSLVPLVYEAHDWLDGVLTGASICSETTAAAEGSQGVLRNDPMAMQPFCGYNFGDYFNHWIELGESMANPPKIFNVNWFLKDEKGKYIWPGFGDNIRVLQWIFSRVENTVDAVSTPLGKLPHPDDIEITGLDGFNRQHVEELLVIDYHSYYDHLEDIAEYLDTYQSRLPKKLKKALEDKIAKFKAML